MVTRLSCQAYAWPYFGLPSSFHMWNKSRVMCLAILQSDIHHCTRRLGLPLGVTSESPARVAACIALLIKLVCQSITHCALSLSTLCGSRGGVLSEVVRVCGDKQWVSPLWFHVCCLFHMGRLSHISIGRSTTEGALCPVSSNSSHLTGKWSLLLHPSSFTTTQFITASLA